MYNLYVEINAVMSEIILTGNKAKYFYKLKYLFEVVYPSTHILNFFQINCKAITIQQLNL